MHEQLTKNVAGSASSLPENFLLQERNKHRASQCPQPDAAKERSISGSAHPEFHSRQRGQKRPQYAGKKDKSSFPDKNRSRWPRLPHEL